ncbi:MAG: hypothetical protein ACI835_003393 [Planctomycetota bacterium]|jgi:hypothetical protein
MKRRKSNRLPNQHIAALTLGLLAIPAPASASLDGQAGSGESYGRATGDTLIRGLGLVINFVDVGSSAARLPRFDGVPGNAKVNVSGWSCKLESKIEWSDQGRQLSRSTSIQHGIKTLVEGISHVIDSRYGMTLEIGLRQESMEPGTSCRCRSSRLCLEPASRPLSTLQLSTEDLSLSLAAACTTGGVQQWR